MMLQARALAVTDADSVLVTEGVLKTDEGVACTPAEEYTVGE